MYCAIIGDIIKSKELLDRGSIQTVLNNVLMKINKDYKDSIASDFLITLGDEFQGVLSTPEKVMDIIDIINTEMYPTKIRHGIGYGEIRTSINTYQAIGADGPAYYNARDAVNNLKQTEGKYESVRQLIYLKTGYYDAHVNLVNACLSICNKIESDWTDKQRKTVKLMRQNKESQSDTARELGINKSSVQKSVRSSKFYYYKHAIETVQQSMIDIWERQYDK